MPIHLLGNTTDSNAGAQVKVTDCISQSKKNEWYPSRRRRTERNKTQTRYQHEFTVNDEKQEGTAPSDGLS